jgi:hypothetical protein
MTDPIAEYEAGLKQLEEKKQAALAALKKQLKEQKREAEKTEARIAELEGRSTTAAAPAANGEKRPRKPSTYVMSDAHKEKLRLGREKRKAAAAKAAKSEKSKDSGK